MGSGKSSIGKRLASELSLPFVDADSEIEEAARMSIAEIFESQGEASFRSGEERVITRLLGNGAQVLATGGGAWMSAETRKNTKAEGISIWLDADLDILMERVGRRSNRPLLQNDNPRQVMSDLLEKRNPDYEKADIRVVSRNVAHEVIVSEIIDALSKFLDETNS